MLSLVSVPTTACQFCTLRGYQGVLIWYIFVNCNWDDTRWQYYSTHLHTNNTQNNTNNNWLRRVWAVPRLCELYPGICLTTEEKARKNLSQGSRRVQVYILPKHTHITLMDSEIFNWPAKSLQHNQSQITTQLHLCAVHGEYVPIISHRVPEWRSSSRVSEMNQLFTIIIPNT
jgi:hypothetical protein